ncbi:flagellar motor protein MotB [Candidatus Magnetaquicoccus inordinatus]|uniref:flagellar motor protein MotB n=1 Tax=Candidatus Magnetaquicoccus inordinatus TaxID=2496818 RepID=UPI00102CA8F8|nr:flagellar motor protein MotB [Candidatus Magnetaquicoccus inordinatus]
MAEQTAKTEEGRSKKAAEEPKKPKCPTCKKGTPLWFISWADMVTLLLCLFVIIVAYSTQEKGRYLTLAGSMRDAFGSKNPDESMPPIARGYHLVNMNFQMKITLVHIAEQAQEVLSAQIERDQAKVISDDSGILIQMDKNILYQAGSATLREPAQALLMKIANIITLLPNTVEIRAPGRDAPGQPFDWEKGMSEAAAIAALFEQQGGIMYNRIQATSMVATDKDKEGTTTAPRKDVIEIKIMKTTNPEE